MKPVLLNTDAVKAILAGRKTTFRRPLKPQPEFLDGETGTPERCGDGNWCFKIDQYTSIYDFDYKPPYQPGDLLYVRETWAFDTGDADDEIGTGCFVYRADDLRHPDCKWRPSIHMPKEAARLFLRVKSVRVQRLKDISAYEAMDTGFSDWNEFVSYWNSTIKPADLLTYGWDANPWVWVVEFEEVPKKEVGQ